ncbi:MAG TPA: OmcA/MtrC family decaheme c-type cytochrome [Thermoanaerobaculia bacterium]|nr:OmcA/MtrC family decaheme c-type cytochrome [Thermoanaerobaculia bacterium]
MTMIFRALVVLAATGVISFPNQPPTQTDAANAGRRRAVTTPAEPQKPVYGPQQVEAYLTDDGIAYIRPGLKIKVNSITIGSDRKAVVDLSFTDNSDQPLDRLGKVTPGAISASFILAWWDPVERHYTSYTTRSVTTPANSPRPGAKGIQAAADSGGKMTDLETGHAKYAFGTALPDGFDATKTHTLGIYSSRNLTVEIGKTYYANVEYDFRPDAGAVKDSWAKISDTTSCLNCHDKETFGFHGGSRRDVKLCVLCHQPQTVDPDTGNTMDFKVMLHKIHSPNLLKEDYIIYGNGQSVHNYSEVTYPQDQRNCDNCHEGTVVASKPAQSDVWYTKPSRDACGSCHDEINWVTGENHPAGPQANDKACATCHVPDSGDEFDASIKAAHVIPVKSKQLKGLNVEIVSATDFAAGKKPTITFKITNGDGTAVDGTKLGSFAPMIAGPTTSYSTFIRESALTKGVFDATKGTTTYTFTGVIPVGSTGTWTVTADARRAQILKRADKKADISVNEGAFNPIKYFALTGAVTPRRTVVTIAQCNKCHDNLALHGGQRFNTDECVICHNPTKGDEDRRVSNTGAAESISFNRMIHRIHTGVELTQDFTIYGNGSSVNNFNEVTFPGDRRNCTTCHTANSYQLPPGGDAVTTLRDYFSPQGPGTASCLGCHDNKDAAAHAFLNTTTFGGKPAEACATCHGANSEWSADKVHAR